MSLGSLEMKGYSFLSTSGRMLVKKGQDVIMTAERRGSLYYLYSSVVKIQKNEVNLAKTTSLKLWHDRLGHPAIGSVKELIKKQIISADITQEPEPCQDCIRGKAKKQSYPTGKHISSSPLDYIHSDL